MGSGTLPGFMQTKSQNLEADKRPVPVLMQAAKRRPLVANRRNRRAVFGRKPGQGLFLSESTGAVCGHIPLVGAQERPAMRPVIRYHVTLLHFPSDRRSYYTTLRFPI